MNSEFTWHSETEMADVLDAILAHSRDGITVLDREGRVQIVGAGTAAAMGLDDVRSAIGRDWREFWPEAERATFDTVFADAMLGNSVRFDGAMGSAGGEPRLWDVTIAPVRGRTGGVEHLLAISSEVTAQRTTAKENRLRWKRAEEQVAIADDITRELRHRIKNQLAVVNAVSKLLSRHSASARDLARKLEEKLISLAHAQDLLAIRRDDLLNARQGVAEVLKASGAGDRVEVADIPDVPLPNESVQQLALLLGELQTNALKHGALKHEEGSVRLSGSIDGLTLSLCWEEHCGAPITPVESGNGGFQLIRRLGVSGGKQPKIAWNPDGIAVQFHLRAAE